MFNTVISLYRPMYLFECLRLHFCNRLLTLFSVCHKIREQDEMNLCSNNYRPTFSLQILFLKKICQEILYKSLLKSMPVE